MPPLPPTSPTPPPPPKRVPQEPEPLRVLITGVDISISDLSRIGIKVVFASVLVAIFTSPIWLILVAMIGGHR